MNITKDIEQKLQSNRFTQTVRQVGPGKPQCIVLHITQVIDYEAYSTVQQMQLSHCAHIIIGSQGAGMTW